MSKFNELLAQLTAAQEEQSTLAKALPVEGGEDDKTIQAAAAEGAEGKKNPEDEESELGEDGKPLAKSMTVDGEEVQIVDAEELIKSLQDLSVRTTETESVLAKGLTAVLELVAGQSVMIKSLQGQITKLGGQGAGRKTVLTVQEKPAVGEQALAKSQAGNEPAVTRDSIMAKANAAFDAGKITGHELTSIDVSLRQGVIPEQTILAKCF